MYFIDYCLFLAQTLDIIQIFRIKKANNHNDKQIFYKMHATYI